MAVSDGQSVFLATPLLTKLGILAALLAGFWAAYAWHGRSEYQRGRAEMAAAVDAKGKEADAANQALAGAKQQSVDQALQHATVKAAELETIRASIKTLDDDRSRTIERLRQSASAGAGEERPAAGAACADHILRRQASDGLVHEGQRIAIEGAELLDQAQRLVGEGQGLIGQQGALIGLCQAYGRAVSLGE